MMPPSARAALRLELTPFSLCTEGFRRTTSMLLSTPPICSTRPFSQSRLSWEFSSSRRSRSESISGLVSAVWAT